MNVYKLHRHTISIVFLMFFLLMPGFTVQATTIPASGIKAAVTDYVKKKSHWLPDRVRVSFLTTVSDEKFTEPSVSLSVSSRSGEDFIDYSSFTVTFCSGGSLLKEKPVSVTIEVLTDVIVSAKTLPRNKRIEPEDLYIRKRWLKHIPIHLAAFSEVVGKALKTTIGANREITRNMLSVPTLFKRGTVVKIVLDNEYLSIATTGVSEEEGRKNEIIRVKNLSSNRVIYARVTSGDTVRIDF